MALEGFAVAAGGADKLGAAMAADVGEPRSMPSSSRSEDDGQVA